MQCGDDHICLARAVPYRSSTHTGWRLSCTTHLYRFVVPTFTHSFRYLLPSGVIQETLTGSDWRYGILFWAGMIAGLIGRRDEGSLAPFAGTLRSSPHFSRTHQEAGKVSAASRKKKAPPATNTNKPKRAKGGDTAASAPALSQSVEPWQLPEHFDADDDGIGAEEAPPVSTSGIQSAAFQELFPGASVADSILEVVCRGAALSGRLAGDNTAVQGGMTEVSAVSMAEEATSFVTRYIAIPFGAVNTPNLHELAGQLLEHLLNHGNLTAAVTSVNESLHSRCKPCYARTNKHVATFVVQLLRAEQTMVSIIKEHRTNKSSTNATLRQLSAPGPDVGPSSTPGAGENMNAKVAAEEPQDEDNDSAEDSSGELDGVQGAGQERQASKSLVRVRCKRTPVARLASMEGRHLVGLGEALGAELGSTVAVVNSAEFPETFEWGAPSCLQRVHASPSTFGKPSWDAVRYSDPSGPGDHTWGRAALVINGVASTARRGIIVQRYILSDSSPRCVRSLFGGVRLQWLIDEKTALPALAFVPLTDVLRLEHIEPAFVPLCERHGVFGTPPNVPDTEEERRAARLFRNHFYP